MMTYRIQHITKYEYVEAVSLCQKSDTVDAVIKCRTR